MYFSEPLTDFRARLNTDDGADSIEVAFNLGTGRWQLVVGRGFSRTTLAEMVRYLHRQFYLGEDEYLADWLQVVEGSTLNDGATLTLKTVDRL